MFIELGGSGADPPEIEFETKGRMAQVSAPMHVYRKKIDTPKAYPDMRGSSEMGYLDEMAAVAYLAREKRCLSVG